MYVLLPLFRSFCLCDFMSVFVSWQPSNALQLYTHIPPHAPTFSYLYRKIPTINRLSWAGGEATNTFQLSGPDFSNFQLSNFCWTLLSNFRASPLSNFPPFNIPPNFGMLESWKVRRNNWTVGMLESWNVGMLES